MVFRIQPHTRLHEWVADELGFFRDEGLVYEFDPDRFAAGSAMTTTVSPAGEVPGQISSGAFEDMAKGRSSDVSCACHWAVNAAAAAQHGRMYGKAYSACPSAISLPADTPFVMGFPVSAEAEVEDVERYFRALLRAQQKIDIEPERYKHFWLKEMPDDVQGLADVRRFGPGERIVPQPYTWEMYERAYRWMKTWDLVDAAEPAADYHEAVLA